MSVVEGGSTPFSGVGGKMVAGVRGEYAWPRVYQSMAHRTEGLLDVSRRLVLHVALVWVDITPWLRAPRGVGSGVEEARVHVRTRGVAVRRQAHVVHRTKPEPVPVVRRKWQRGGEGGGGEGGALRGSRSRMLWRGGYGEAAVKGTS